MMITRHLVESVCPHRSHALCVFLFSSQEESGGDGRGRGLGQRRGVGRTRREPGRQTEGARSDSGSEDEKAEEGKKDEKALFGSDSDSGDEEE